ncbi:MAG: N-acetylmuramoyl-L-alanine amidase [Fimbriimonas sp.]
MSNLIPESWMPNASMRRVILHWTGGTNDASDLDREHYHLIIEGDGNLERGKHSIADNENTGDGRYAAHALNCNQNSIGVSLCGMLGAQQSPYKGGKYEITRKQWATAARVVAELCDRYNIPVSPQTVLQHG